LTLQTREIFLYKGVELRSYDTPLSNHPTEHKFLPLGSFCWRGYQGTWRINDKKLYLINLHAQIQAPGKTTLIKKLRYDSFLGRFYYEAKHEPIAIMASLKDIFPESNTKEVFAEWFTGSVRFGLGKIIHQGVNLTHSKYLLLRFKNGVLISENYSKHT
jgi:hypothetical protein